MYTRYQEYWNVLLKGILVGSSHLSQGKIPVNEKLASPKNLYFVYLSVIIIETVDCYRMSLP